MTGLLLSHIFVRPNEEYKFHWVQNALKKYLDLEQDFFIVLSGHGIKPPKYITDKCNEIFWITDIKENELGRGHPYFCIKGFEICQLNNCEFTLKNRAYDYIENKDIFKHNLLVTEQTDLDKKIIGDLLMYGKTDYLLNWWNKSEWDYSTNGLSNLYEKKFDNFSDNAVFMNPQQIGWKTFEDNSTDFWGKQKGYEWYGGKGLKNAIDIS
tara:strand:- start:8388 stop:9017 length:630 start_codon:yes stop_codon:yes gene_type:complete